MCNTKHSLSVLWHAEQVPLTYRLYCVCGWAGCEIQSFIVLLQGPTERSFMCIALGVLLILIWPLLNLCMRNITTSQTKLCHACDIFYHQIFVKLAPSVNVPIIIQSASNAGCSSADGVVMMSQVWPCCCFLSPLSSPQTPATPPRD